MAKSHVTSSIMDPVLQFGNNCCYVAHHMIEKLFTIVACKELLSLQKQ